MSATAAQRVLLIGGTSEIGLAIVRRLARDRPVRPVLLGRDRARLERALAELQRAGCESGSVALVDAGELERHDAAIGEAFAGAGGFELVILAVGVLGAQEALDADPAVAREVMEVDFVGAGSLLIAALRALRAQDSGTVVALSSVAVERARASNAIYGAAKAGFDALAQALADAVAGTGVRVLIARPGFVRTRMTAGLPVPPFATTPEAVADGVVRALGGKAVTVWTPPILR